MVSGSPRTAVALEKAPAHASGPVVGIAQIRAIVRAVATVYPTVAQARAAEVDWTVTMARASVGTNGLAAMDGAVRRVALAALVGAGAALRAVLADPVVVELGGVAAAAASCRYRSTGNDAPA